MAKKTFQDVLPPNRSIRNIELPSRRQPQSQPMSHARVPEPPVYEDESRKFEKKVEMKRPVSAPPPVDLPDESHTQSYTYAYDEPKKSSRKMLYGAGVVLILALAFGISAFFKSAHITVTPRNETHALKGVLVSPLIAQKDVTTGLGFQVVTVSHDSQTQVPATGSQSVSTKASGTIVIYNNASAAPQKLIATTRFQTSAGLVYRLVSAVTIPGKTGTGTKSVAGSIEAKVVADAPGDTYNIGLSDFTLPAFKGDPKYTTIYARSKTPMTGGFSGDQKVVSAADASSSESMLQTQLKAALVTDITSQIPANFVLYSNDVTFSFEPTEQATGSSTGQTMAVLQKTGTAQAIIFDRAALSQAIVARVLPDATSSAVKVDNLDTLTFAYASTSAAGSAGNAQISFMLTGDAHFVWTFDENKLKADMLGLTKTQAQALIATQYPAVQEAWIETKPFWNTTIPLDANKVTLTNTLDK